MEINIDIFKRLIDENTWVKVILNVLLGIFVLYIFHHVFIVKYAARLVHARSNLEILRTRAHQYQTFSGLETQTKQLRTEMAEVLASLGKEIFVQGQTEKGLLNQVGDLCQKTGVKLDRINPISIDTGQAWNVSFKAPFRNINNFLSTLEKNFRIESLSILRGGGEDHTVDMVIAPITVAEGSANTNPKERADYFNLFLTANETLNELRKQRAMNMEYAQTTIDPFTGQDLNAKKIVVQGYIEPPPIIIEGIFWDPEVPVVVIQGKALQEGESFKDIKIIKIYENSVTVKWHSNMFTLQSKKEPQ